MAARKLKFKPKPFVGGAVRRPREKEVLELTSQEPNVKQESSHENISSHGDVKTDKNSTGIEHDASGGNVSKRIRIEQAENTILAPPTDIGGKTIGLTSSSASNLVKGNTDETTKNIASNKTTEQFADLNVVRTVCLEEVSSQSSESSTSAIVNPLCSQEPSGDEPSSETKSPPKTETNSVTSPTLSQESRGNCKSTDKTEVTKVLPRFGRSKFKPVLNNNISRKKTELNDNTINNENAKTEVFPVAIIRTESVIKCVKSEAIKSSIVSEITESFSALESDESDPPLVSPLQTKENELSKNTCRFDNDNEDVRTSMNESGTNNRVYLVNTKKPMQPTINVTESNRCELGTSNLESYKITDQTDSNQLHQILDNVHDSEISNSNVQTSSATKVPISPLKLTSKILVPKPSPNLLDTATRRISFHGSDSEEESKRKILNNNKLGKKIKKEKDMKTNKRKLSHGSTYSKLGQEALEKFTQKFGKVGKLEPTDKARLTMLDLIFYNPKSNPMSASTEQTVVRKKEEKCEVNGMVREALAEQSVDDVEEVEAPAPAPAVPVPQLKVGPDGQIMLDPNSLVIETTEVKEKRAEMEKSEVIRESGITRYNTYSKKKHIRKDWSAQETLQFYKALNTIGSDFTLMTKLFPKRSRHELKLKFKKEEKTNMKLIDLAMTAPTDFDFSSLEEEMKRENEEIARLEEEKKMAAEAAKKARAQRKEEKQKNKGKKIDFHRLMKVKDAAFKDFDDAEIEKMKMDHDSKTKKKKKRVVKRKKQPVMLIASSSDEEEVPISIDDSDEADLEESEMKLLKMIREKTRAGSIKGRKIKRAKKLEEYEEINETLKRKLEEIDSDSSDGYTPNGPGADMLFGSPARDPFPDNPSQEGDGSQWSMEVTSVPSVEDTVVMNDVVSVSEQSELGSFEQNVSALDLSLPLGTSTHFKVAQGSKYTDSVLNRHLISESIQIIDQLTSNEHLNENSEKVTSENLIEDRDPSKSPTKQEPGENRIALPSFESVSRSRPPVVYSIQEQYVPAQSDEDSAKTCEKNSPSVIPAASDQQHDKSKKDSNEQGIVLSYYSNDSEECILGD